MSGSTILIVVVQYLLGFVVLSISILENGKLLGGQIFKISIIFPIIDDNNAI